MEIEFIYKIVFFWVLFLIGFYFFYCAMTDLQKESEKFEALAKESIKQIRGGYEE